MTSHALAGYIKYIYIYIFPRDGSAVSTESLSSPLLDETHFRPNYAVKQFLVRIGK